MKKMGENYLLVEYNRDFGSRLSIVEIGNHCEKLDGYYEQMDCDLVDHVFIGQTYEGENLEFIVDDEGLLKSGNPVHEVTVTDEEGNHTFQLAGNFLIGTAIATEEGVSFTGFETAEMLADTLSHFQTKISLVGFLR